MNLISRPFKAQRNLPFVISLTLLMLFVTSLFLRSELTSVWMRGGSRLHRRTERFVRSDGSYLHRRAGRFVRLGETAQASRVPQPPTQVLMFPVSLATLKKKIIEIIFLVHITLYWNLITEKATKRMHFSSLTFVWYGCEHCNNFQEIHKVLLATSSQTPNTSPYIISISIFYLHQKSSLRLQQATLHYFTHCKRDTHDDEFADLTCCVGATGLRCEGYWSMRASPSRWISLWAADKYFLWCIRTITHGKNNWKEIKNRWDRLLIMTSIFALRLITTSKIRWTGDY